MLKASEMEIPNSSASSVGDLSLTRAVLLEEAGAVSHDA
jgi:hypothetical protein